MFGFCLYGKTELLGTPYSEGLQGGVRPEKSHGLLPREDPVGMWGVLGLTEHQHRWSCSPFFPLLQNEGGTLGSLHGM